ncbi:hypothetical protein C1646_719148 [Rhizophagus diaphanus]|nr:hypothetical protein C1646_719148 [Rhizophagus diaphanus] [Rhizophagus sp. MUCL 43196]
MDNDIEMDSDIEMDMNYELSSEIESTATNDSDIEMDNNDQLTIETSHRTNINKYDSQVPRKKSNRNINAKEKGRYSTSELIEVLTFINDNLDLWNASPPIACSKAIEATNINRDSTSVYNKIHSLIREVSEYLETGKKPSPNAIIWEEKMIYELVMKIYNKTREITKDEKSEDDNEINNLAKYDNKTKNKRKIEEIYIKTEKKSDNNFKNKVKKKSKEKIVEMTDEVVQNSIDQVRKKSEEKIVEIREMEEKIVKNDEELAKITGIITKEEIRRRREVVRMVAEEKIVKIKKIEVEIIQAIRNINDKHKQLKEIQT